MTSFLRAMQRNVRRSIFAGLLVITPIAITYFVLKAVFDLIENTARPLVEAIFGRQIAGVGLLGLLILLYILGVLTTFYLGRRLVQLGHAIISRVPVIQIIYKATKDAVDSLATVRGAELKRVVVVQFPREGMYSLGFATGQIRDQGGNLYINVYIPTTPNPTSGFIVLVPEKDVHETNLTVDEAMKIIISAGILTPQKFEFTLRKGE